jgi:hypothetical protein
MSWLAIRKVPPWIERDPKDVIRALSRRESLNGICEAHEMKQETFFHRIPSRLDLLHRLLQVWSSHAEDMKNLIQILYYYEPKLFWQCSFPDQTKMMTSTGQMTRQRLMNPIKSASCWTHVGNSFVVQS